MKKLNFLFLFLILFTAARSQAATYHIAKTGSNSTTCPNADFGTTARAKLTIMGATGGLQCLASGDTLIIHAGTYSELLTTLGNAYMPSGVSDAARTNIQGNTGETIIVNGIDNYSRSYITFKNIISEGYSSHIGRAAVADTPSTFVTLDNVTARNWLPGASSSGGAGFNVGFRQESVSSNIILLNCTANNNGGNKYDHGVYITTRDATVNGGSFFNNTGHGIHAYSGTSGATNNTLVKYARAYSNGSYGIGLMAGVNMIAHNNLAYGNGTLQVSGGISLRLGGRGAIYNNTTYNNNGAGIQNEDYTTNIVRNNIAYLNSTNLNYIITPTNSNNITTNPLFVNTTDFQLSSGSPAIGAALDLTATIGNTDFDGTVRTGGWDAGAQEVPVGTETITLLNPNSGTLGVTGSAQSISWGSTGITNVRLRYSANGSAFTSPVVVSASVTATLQTFQFTAPAAGTTYRFEVCDAADNTPCDMSDSDVVITASAGGSLTKIISENTVGTKIGDIPGIEDTDLDKNHPVDNHSTAPIMGMYKFSAAGHAHPVIRATGFSQLPTTANIISTTFGFWVQGGAGATGHTADVRKVNRNWVLSQVNWNNFSTGNPWTTPGALNAPNDRDSATSCQINGITLTAQYYTCSLSNSLVQNWTNLSVPNYGIHIERNGAGEEIPGQYRDITSSRGTDGHRPYFEVTYTTTTPTITIREPDASTYLYSGFSVLTNRWQTEGVSGSLKIDLSYDGGISYTTIIPSYPYAQPDATWTVTGRGCTHCIVRACSIDQPTICGLSPEFRIAPYRVRVKL